MSELKKINTVMNKFITGIRKNNFSDMHDIFTENVKSYTSITKEAAGREEVTNSLYYKGPKPDKIKQNIENIMTHIHGSKAQQSFHIVMLFIKDKNDVFHYAQYGGTYEISYEKSDNGWRISKIIYDLTWTEGNNHWFKNWKQIDYTMPKVYKKVVDPLLDSVHHTFPVCDERTDEREVAELIFIYGWVIDTEDYDILYAKTTDQFYVWDDYHKARTDGSSNWAGVLRGLNQREPALHHTFRIKELKINGNKATGKFSRMEPNRIVNKNINNQNWTHDFFTLDYTGEFVKVNGIWLINKIEASTVLYEEKGNAYFEYL